MMIEDDLPVTPEDLSLTLIVEGVLDDLEPEQQELSAETSKATKEEEVECSNNVTLKDVPQLGVQEEDKAEEKTEEVENLLKSRSLVFQQ